MPCMKTKVIKFGSIKQLVYDNKINDIMEDEDYLVASYHIGKRITFITFTHKAINYTIYINSHLKTTDINYD